MSAKKADPPVNLAQMLGDVQAAINRSGARALLALEEHLTRAQAIESGARDAEQRAEQAQADEAAARAALDGFAGKRQALETELADTRRSVAEEKAAMAAVIEAARRAHGEEMAALARTMVATRQELEEIHAGEVARRQAQLEALEAQRVGLEEGIKQLRAKGLLG